MSYIKGYKCTLCGAEFKEGEVLMTLYTKKEAPDVNIDNIFTID